MNTNERVPLQALSFLLGFLSILYARFYYLLYLFALTMTVNSARIISCFGCVVYGWTPAHRSWTAHCLDAILIPCHWALNGPALEAVLVTLMMKATNNSVLSCEAGYVDLCVRSIELYTNELMSYSYDSFTDHEKPMLLIAL